jgi:hypothetical protein
MAARLAATVMAATAILSHGRGRRGSVMLPIMIVVIAQPCWLIKQKLRPWNLILPD